MMRSVEDEKRADEERTSLLIKKNTNNNDGNPENNTSSEEEEEEQYSYYYHEEEDTEEEEENLIVETPPSTNSFSSRKEHFFSPNESDWKKTSLSRMISTSKDLLFCNASTLRVLLTVLFITGALLTGASYGSRFGGDLYVKVRPRRESAIGKSRRHAEAGVTLVDEMRYPYAKCLDGTSGSYYASFAPSSGIAKKAHLSLIHI